MWNFADLIHPQIMMEAPEDVMVLRFNPTQPSIIASGLFNGQICVWDISKAESHISTKTRNTTTTTTNATLNHQSTSYHRMSSISGVASSDDSSVHGTTATPPVKPMHVSYIDLSHRRPVADLVWMPAGIEINHRGHVVMTNDHVSHQFITVAGDGQVCFWDLRFQDPKYRMAYHGRLKLEKNSHLGKAKGTYMHIYA
jgi:WD40 repeat protein